MRTTRSDLAAKIIGICLGVMLGVGGAAMIGQQASYDRVANDRCWVAGGEYNDGTCEMPKKSDLMLKAEKACRDGEEYYILSSDVEVVIHCMDPKNGTYEVKFIR